MRIIVINLARATERRAKIEAQFAAFPLPFEFLTATDGRTVNDADRALVDNAKRKAITPFPLTDNEIGCWLSHKRAMQVLLDSGEAMAVIIEDDAQLSPGFPAILNAIEKCGRSFDAIDLHRNFRRREIFRPVQPLIPGNALGRIGYTHMKATAYVISHQGAQKFLAYAPRFAHAVDKELHRYWANGLDLYGLEQPVAVQEDGGHSFIEETRNQDRQTQRLRYPDSNAPYWRFRRRWTALADSMLKRIAFATLSRT